VARGEGLILRWEVPEEPLRSGRAGRSGSGDEGGDDSPVDAASCSPSDLP
jgi:hypothetical protein